MLPPSSPSPRSVRLAAWVGGVVAPVVYITIWATAGAMTRGYDPTAQAISELAAVGAPTRPVMTTAFVVFGLLSVPFARAVGAVLPGDSGRLQIALVVTGLATVAAGALPCSEGCPGPAASWTDLGHTAAATVGYTAFVLAPFLLAWQLRGRTRPPWPTLSRVSIAVGTIAGGALIVWALGLGGTSGGLLQRGFNTLLDGWWIGLAVVVLRRSRTGGEGDERLLQDDLAA